MITSEDIHHTQPIQENKNNKISQNITIKRRQMAEKFNLTCLAARPCWNRKTGIGKNVLVYIITGGLRVVYPKIDKFAKF